MQDGTALHPPVLGPGVQTQLLKPAVTSDGFQGQWR